MTSKPKRGNPPAFQLYADDFVAGTMNMDPEEVGAYILLLCYQWTHDDMPTDMQRLARISRVSEHDFAHIWESTLKEKFLGPGGTNPRLQSLKEERLAYIEKQASNGRLGGRPKNPPLSSGLTQTKAKANPNESSPVSSLLSPVSSSQSPEKKIAPKRRARSRAKPPSEQDTSDRKAVYAHFEASYFEAYGKDYSHAGAKDGALLKRIVSKLGKGDLGEIRERIDRAFADDWLRERGIDLGTISSAWAKLVVPKNETSPKGAKHKSSIDLFREKYGAQQ